MAKFSVGVLVKIVGMSTDNEIERRTLAKYLGHVGRILGTWPALGSRPEEGIRYEVEGADPEIRCFPAAALRIVGDDNQKSSWEEIEKITKWSPERVEA